MMSSSKEGREQEQPTKTTLTYKDPNTREEIALTRYKGKTGGKNLDEAYDGFYSDGPGEEDDTGKKYFVKKPKKKHELFTELFTGLLFEELKKYIEPSLHEALICASAIKLPDGSYGLIQPCIKFEELFKLIGTGTADNKDRSAAYEAVWGKQQYRKILELGNVRGLTIALLFSLIVGDYSFHSGNIAAIKKKVKNNERKIIEFLLLARIDWGAALRNFGEPKNNEDIMVPYEYYGMLNYTKLTKNYIANFKDIDGLFNGSIPTKAQELLNGNPSISTPPLTQETLEKIILKVIEKIPQDMFTLEDRLYISKYIRIPSIKNALCGNKTDNESFAKAMTKIMFGRISSISKLEIKKGYSSRPSEKSEASSDMYRSVMDPFSDNSPEVVKTNPPSDDLSSSLNEEDFLDLGIEKEKIEKESPSDNLSSSSFEIINKEQILQSLDKSLREEDFVNLSIEEERKIVEEEIKFENIISAEVAVEQVNDKKYKHEITLAELLDLHLEINAQNIALKDFATDKFHAKVSNDLAKQTRQFILDFIDRNFKVNGMAHLGLTKIEVEDFKKNITDPEKQYEFIINRLTVLLGDKDSAEKLFKSHNQFSAGFIPFLLERSLIGEMDSSENPGEGITITQPSDAVIDVIKKSDGSIDHVIHFEGLPIIEKQNKTRIGTFPGPIEVHCKTKEIKGVWGFELDKIVTDNKKVIDVLRGGMLKQQEIIDEYFEEIVKKRKTPGEMAATSIGRFFENKYKFRYHCVGIKKSAALGQTQTISNGIVFYTFEDIKKGANTHVHAFYPTCDSDHSHIDTISLRHALQIFKESVKIPDGKNHKLVIPLATSKLMQMRQHWLDLFIEIDAEGNVSAKLTDSQAIGYLYPTAYISDVINKIFGVPLKTEYLNQQSPLNFTDCCDFCILNQDYDLNITSKRVQEIDQDILRLHREIEEKYRPKVESVDSDVVKRKIPTNTSHEFSDDELKIEPDVVLLSEPLNAQFEPIEADSLNESAFEMMHTSDLNDSSFAKLGHSIVAANLYKNQNPEDDVWANDRYMQQYCDKKIPSPEEMSDLSKTNWKDWDDKGEELQKDLSNLKEELAIEKRRSSAAITFQSAIRGHNANIQMRDEKAKRREKDEQLKLEMQRQEEEKKRKEQQHQQELEAKRLEEEQKRLEQQREQEKKHEEERIRIEKEQKETLKREEEARQLKEERIRKQELEAKRLEEEQKRLEQQREQEKKREEEARQLEEERIRNKSDSAEVVKLFTRSTEQDEGEPSSIIQVSQTSPGFFSRHKGKILGGILSGLASAIPGILILTGVILLPVTFGGSAALIGIGVGVMIGGALIGGSVGVGVGALFDKRRSSGTGGGDSGSIEDTYTGVTRKMQTNGKGTRLSRKSIPEITPPTVISGAKPTSGQAPRNDVPSTVQPGQSSNNSKPRV